MTLKVSVKHDLKGLKKEFGRQNREIPRIMSQALNQTARQVKSAAVKEIAKEVGLPQKVVRDSFRLRLSNFRRLSAEVEASGRPLNLIRFKARQTRRGVVAKAWGKRRLYPHTFIGNDGRTVFVRKGRARLPIRPVFGPSIPRTMAQKVVSDRLNEVIAKRWPINLGQAIRRRRPGRI